MPTVEELSIMLINGECLDIILTFMIWGGIGAIQFMSQRKKEHCKWIDYWFVYAVFILTISFYFLVV